MSTSTPSNAEEVRSGRPPVGAEQPPLQFGPAMRLIVRCAARTTGMLTHHRLRLPEHHLGMRIAFADGSTGLVYRETVADGYAVEDPVVLVVEFQLKVLSSAAGHAYFRAVSLLNTPLFAGFAGFRSKLWLAADERGRYRGIYQWDGAEAALEYVHALWWPLALVSYVDSIHYCVLPGLWRDDVMRLSAQLPEPAAAEWWRVVGVDPAP
jgi:hypothetical protein